MYAVQRGRKVLAGAIAGGSAAALIAGFLIILHNSPRILHYLLIPDVYGFMHSMTHAQTGFLMVFISAVLVGVALLVLD